jgi:folate-binding protein YgfZ
MREVLTATKPLRGEEPCTVLRLEGRDVLAVLHNISTQSLLDLAPGAARMTLFCDFRGRLLHRAAVIRDAEGTVWLVRPDAPGAELAAHVNRHVFREDVRVTDLSQSRTVIAFPIDDRLAAETVAERDGRLEAQLPGSLWIKVAPLALDERAHGLLFGGSERGRIASGWPRHGHEIAEAFHPYEVNLGGDVHLDKGCYTGQEVLMRLITYRSVRRRLVRLTGMGIPVEPFEVADEAGVRIGILTSAEIQDADTASANWSALAVVRNESARTELGIRVAGATQATIAGVFPLATPAGRPVPR